MTPSYPIAVIMSKEDKVAYAFMSDGIKKLDRLSFLRKGSPLLQSATRNFNDTNDNVVSAKRMCAETHLNDWFDCSRHLQLDEEIIGLGEYGYTLTVLSSDNLPVDTDDDEDEEQRLEESWTPKFAYGR